MKKHFFTAVGLSVMLAGSVILPDVSPAAARSSSLSVIERIDTSENGFVHSKYINEDGEEVSLSGHASTSANKRKSSSLPSSYDFRENSAITPVKNQGVTGGCWAFAAIKSLEADSILQNLSDPAGTDYSESHLIWYAYNRLTDTTSPLYGDYLSTQVTNSSDYYNLGGNAYIASFILANWWGAVSENKAPFAADTTQELKQMARSMKNQPESLRSQSEVHLKETRFFEKNDLSGIKEAVMEHGAVDAALYYNTSNMYHSSSVTSAYETSHTEDDANHCVTIVGWDDDFNTFSSETPGSGAWLIANSYGEDYSMSNNGYYWVSYYDTSLCEFSTFEAESTDTYDTNFQYDGIGWGDLYYDTADITFANIFTNGTDSPRSIGAAGFYTTAADQKYKIEVYRNITGTLPTSGTLVPECTTYGTVPNSGYHTISLTEPVAVAAGETFSVVVTFYSENGSTVYVSIEGSSDPFSTHYSSRSGQSFVYSDGKWSDNTAFKIGRFSRNMNNVCLKALAHTITESDYQKQEEAHASQTPATSPEPSDSTPQTPGNTPVSTPAETGVPTISPESPFQTPDPATPANSFSPETSPTTAAPLPSDDAGQMTPFSSLTPSLSSSPKPSDLPVSATPAPTAATNVSGDNAKTAVTITTGGNRTVSSSSGTLIIVNKTKLILQKGKSSKVPITVKPESMKKKLTYKSKNKKIAIVNKKGIIHAKKKGTTKIIIKTPDKAKIKIKLIVKKSLKTSR